MAFDTALQLTAKNDGAAALSDEDLIARSRSASDRGESDDLFGELLARYYVRILRWCFRFTGDRDMAPDLAQEILLRAYRSFDTFRGDSRFSTWIYVITRNHCMTAMKKRAAEPAHIDQSDAALVPDARAADAYNAIESRHAARRRLHSLMTALTDTEARVMMLHYGEELPLAAITRALGLTNRSGAKAYIVSARRKLSCFTCHGRNARAEPPRSGRIIAPLSPESSRLAASTRR
jgi:RNA polymerase sigma factor (sigma-70 family)